ncbi:MAG: ATP/GTP-binding protein [Thermoproteales archaeon]|nr:ATP/GTP-binding protein [Thermoproteales archaeon]
MSDALYFDSKQITIFLGPAGSGKTTMVGAFGSWLSNSIKMNVGYVNLDPGAEILPYKPHFDIRKMFTIKDIMIREKLGPNGAFIKSMDLMLKSKSKILAAIKGIRSDFILIDTPGQMELFVFRETGPAFLMKLKEIGYVVGVLIFDPVMAQSPSSFVAMKLLSIVAQLRLGIDNIIVLNKIDAIKDKNVLKMIEDSRYLKEVLSESCEGVIGDMAFSLLNVIDDYMPASRLVKISALKSIGFEELYDILHEIFCTCGDLT